MSFIKIKSLKIKNYRSFWEEQIFNFPENYNKPIAIIGYNNAGKTNLMNTILYWVWEKYVREDCFEKSDLHNLNYNNPINIKISLDWNVFWVDKYWKQQTIKWDYSIYTTYFDKEIVSKMEPSLFWKNKHYKIFYINFHNIKEEISTQKTSWGILRSFLAKHIKKLVDNDIDMKLYKWVYDNMINSATSFILDDSDLQKFIYRIQKYYNQNLRNNAVEVDFWLPDYEDIFLQMMFKIWLNGNRENLVPINHFGDWYISMFIMAVIQAIAEENNWDQCLFLFEEPESFLHENHQEYFYKMVLCSLAEKWHQVIYTTHSDKMINIFDTKWIIRLELKDRWNWDFQTERVVKDIWGKDFWEPQDEDWEIVAMSDFNNYIKNIEPNLNKILFSKKVILVEWPNDLLVYKTCIEKIIEEKIQYNSEIQDKKRYAETYLNFHNIAIIPHHWKITAVYLVELCKYFWVEFFLINDWDFWVDFIEDINEDFEQIKFRSDWNQIEQKVDNPSEKYSEKTIKWMITTNKNLIDVSDWNIHFNVPKLEKIIWYDSNDKDSLKIFQIISKNIFDYKNEKLFPDSLIQFLEIDKIFSNIHNNIEEQNISSEILPEDIPF